MKRFLLSSLICLVAVVVQAGVIYTARTTIEVYNPSNEAKSEQQDTANLMTTPQEMKAFVQDKGARIKFLTDYIFYQKGDFMVTEDGKTMYMCSPETKTYHKLNLEGMMQSAQGVLKAVQKFTKMTYSNVFVTVNDLGDGGTVAGYATKKYRVLVEYDVDMKILFKKIKEHSKEEYIIYTTEKLPFDLMPEYTTSQVFKTGIDQVDSQIQSKVTVIGFPLKSEHMSYGKNNELKSKATFEITSLEQKDLNPALFKLPNGYTEKQMEVETTDEQGHKEKKKLKLGDLF